MPVTVMVTVTIAVPLLAVFAASWKVSVPGRGHGSPIIVGTRVFLESADEQDKIQTVTGDDVDVPGGHLIVKNPNTKETVAVSPDQFKAEFTVKR